MRTKIILKKCCFSISIFIISPFGCNEKAETIISDKKGLFNGLYSVELDWTEDPWVWIFTEDMHYALFPTSMITPDQDMVAEIGYYSPTHYYVKGNKFYYCGRIGYSDSPEPLDKCKKNNSNPDYIIARVDTVENKYQVILLERYPSKSTIKLTRKL